MNGPDQPKFARRAVVRLIAAAAASPALLAACATPAGTPVGRASARQPPGPAGTPTDPDLIHPVRPWPLTLDAEQQRTLGALCDLIFPADARSPAASALGAPAFIDEWVSAPYPAMQHDGAVLRGGLAWLDTQSTRLGGVPFHAAAPAQQAAICDAICDARAATPEAQDAAYFFDRVRELCVIACCTTPEGMADLGYVGNVPLAEWLAPPPEVLRHAGLG